MLDETAVRKLLEPFDLQMSSGQCGQIIIYLNLLLRWNSNINLTSIRTEEESVTRHFGESLYLASFADLRGSLLDIGSGAGFPGLALRIAFPELITTLLEPVSKKRTFLKEVARACGFSSVDVRPERLEDYVRQSPAITFDTVTARAVGHLKTLVPQALKLLRSEGQICLWLGHGQGLAVEEPRDGIHWRKPIQVPLAREREIWVGTKA